ncbi:MAG: mechanosensitive ion channel protein MscL [Gammaproteobacteria bacterium RIFCSPHIGHO2_12_FULL_37_14]|nr:MAG: mechanosensitive ion channel protein MscL [Gammaproteobacteria bacterium RIFCSPHIGHO2_12_FULL_37_14]
MWKEFKEFAMRGNVIDMAVGIIIGSAFGKIISSLVNDVIMPPIGMLLGKVDFSNLTITLLQQTSNSSAVTIKYGVFVNSLIDFIIVAFAMFIVIKQVNRFTRSQANTEHIKDCPYCCSKISVNASRCPDCTSQLSQSK